MPSRPLRRFATAALVLALSTTIGAVPSAWAAGADGPPSAASVAAATVGATDADAGGAGIAGAPAGRFHAGATARETHSVSAALRNGGNATLRVSVWYPAPAASPEKVLEIGETGKPLFVADRVAFGAPWADDAKHPVILISHGFGGAGQQMAWLGAALARAGYVAIAVDHPGTNGRDGVTAAGIAAPWERVGDLAAALDLVLADARLGSHVDAARVGVAGFSLGGYTSALVVGARTDYAHFDAFCKSPARDFVCERQAESSLDYEQGRAALAAPEMAPLAAREHADLADPRVRAALLIDPALGEGLEPASLARVRVPVLVVYGTDDPVAPPATNGLLLAHAIPGARTLALPGVRHYDFLDDCGAFGRQVAAPLCTDGAGTTRAATHASAIAAATTFFGETLAPR